MKVAEDPVARADDVGGLALHEDTKRLAVAAEDGIDDDPCIVNVSCRELG
jgi:hypothetical protein